MKSTIFTSKNKIDKIFISHVPLMSKNKKIEIVQSNTLLFS